MTQEEKQLLLVDLCGRLPYGVKITDGSNVIKANLLICIGVFVCDGKWKPYLRPMSSMTDEEYKEYRQLWLPSIEHEFEDPQLKIDWLNKKMFDYRGLIPMKLALEAPEGMYGKEAEK